MTVDEIYAAVLDELDEEDDATLKAKVLADFNKCSRQIQAFAGVVKVWSISIVVNTETYASGLTDFYLAHEGRFRRTATTDVLANYDLWRVLPEYEWAKSGFWVSQSKTLYVRPAPTTAGTLKIYGEKVLAALDYAATTVSPEVSTPEIDSEFHDVYLWYACMRYGSRDEDTDTNGSRYWRFKQEYDAIVNEMARRYVEREGLRVRR